VGSCSLVFYVSFSCFPRFSIILDPTGLLGKYSSAYEELKDNEGGILGLLRVLVGQLTLVVLDKGPLNS